MTYTMDEILQEAGELPPLPQVAKKALTILQKPNSNMQELADVLVLDQAMTGLILRWVNSAYFGLWNPVTTVHQAVVYLGQRTLESLVLTASVVNLVSGPVPGYGLDQSELWKHSIGVAAGARLIAKRIGYEDPEIAYHAGLLCDIGRLVQRVLLKTPGVHFEEWHGKPFSEFEEAFFGVDHAALGGLELRQAAHRLPGNKIGHGIKPLDRQPAEAIDDHPFTGRRFGQRGQHGQSGNQGNSPAKYRIEPPAIIFLPLCGHSWSR